MDFDDFLKAGGKEGEDFLFLSVRCEFYKDGYSVMELMNLIECDKISDFRPKRVKDLITFLQYERGE